MTIDSMAGGHAPADVPGGRVAGGVGRPVADRNAGPPPLRDLDPLTAAFDADLPSRNPVERTRSEHRFDVFWDDVWTGGSRAWWTSPAREARDSELRFGRTPSKWLIDRDEALEYLLWDRNRVALHTLIGLLHTWRTLSIQQVAALSGLKRLGAPALRLIQSAFAAGIVEVGAFPSPVAVQQRMMERGVLRLAQPTRVIQREVMPLMTWPEWVATTACFDFQAGGQYDRHNLLAADLCVRAAEFTSAAGVLGERFTSMTDLAGALGDGLGWAPAPRRGDAMVLRADGVKVVIEVCAARSRVIGAKARRWAELLERLPWERSGLMVLFVSALPPHGTGGTYSVGDRAALFEAVARATSEVPGPPSDRTANRIGVASWTDWFPASHMVDESFRSLRAWFPTGDTVESRWRALDVLDPESVVFDPGSEANRDAALALLSNMAYVNSGAHWLRPSHERELWPMLLRGDFESIPVPAPSKAHRPRVSEFGLPRGAAGPTTPAPRLLVNGVRSGLAR